MVTVTSATLANLSDRVAVPEYPRDAVTTGVVHFGVGAFHRAHQAKFLDDIVAAGASEWGICGVGMLPGDRALRDVFRAQDNLYTLVTVAPDGISAARVIGSIVEYLYAPEDGQAVLAKLADPITRIVSLTITEGGYNVSDATGEFDPQDPATRADLEGSGADAPQSVLGYIVAGLRMRRAAGTPPFTVMSCDNIQANGQIARTAVRGFAERTDPELAAWIEQNVAFPSSMVDRITPATTDQTREKIAAEFGVDDAWPVRSEAFEQWVLEDWFPAGRPAFQDVGVQVVDDVEPYELMKLRLLNASHQAMSYLGILSGANFVHEVCTDPLFVEFLLGYMREEARPTLRPVPGIDLDAYCDQLIARFSSVAIEDTLARQVVDGSDRIAKFLLPVLADQLAVGDQPGCQAQIRRSALVLAAWSVFLEGRTEAGLPTPIADRRRAELEAAVRKERTSPGSFLDYTPVFGDLGQDPILRTAFIDARATLAQHGARTAIAALGGS